MYRVKLSSCTKKKKKKNLYIILNCTLWLDSSSCALGSVKSLSVAIILRRPLTWSGSIC